MGTTSTQDGDVRGPVGLTHITNTSLPATGPGGTQPVSEADGANAALGAKADAAASSDTGTFSQISLFKRLLQHLTSLLAKFGTGASSVTVQGTAADGAAAVGNPVLAAGMDGSSLAQAFFASASGVQRFHPARSSDGTEASFVGFGATALSSSANGFAAPAYIYVYTGNAGASGMEVLRTPIVYKTVSLAAGTAETTIWAPAASKKFRLMGFILTCGAASTLTFKDNTGGTTIFIARGTTDTPITFQPVGNGILSAAANNVLTVTRGTSCTLDGVVWGTEE